VSALRRAFVAVVPPPVVRRWTATVAASLREGGDAGLRWAPVAQHHLTLQFLGPVPDGPAVSDALRTSFRTVEPFDVVLAGGGAFPVAGRASVLWLGVAQGSGALSALAAVVARATAAVGIAPEDRAYRPHVTLARTNRARDVRALVDRLDAATGPTWTVRDAALFESTSSTRDGRTTGAVHTEVARVRLAG
jgi:RNA 2',3'-cyclic 3'-phosphodiesterase